MYFRQTVASRNSNKFRRPVRLPAHLFVTNGVVRRGWPLRSGAGQMPCLRSDLLRRFRLGVDVQLAAALQELRALGRHPFQRSALVVAHGENFFAQVLRDFH